MTFNMLLYETAAYIIDNVLKKKQSLKNSVFQCKFKNKKQLFALVCETLKYRLVLEQIIDDIKLLKLEKKLGLKSKTFVVVLLYEFLFGKGLKAAGKWTTCILAHKTPLKAELARIKIRSGAIKDEDLISAEVREANLVLPRYVRVNTLKTDITSVIQQFLSEGYAYVEVDKIANHQSYTETLMNLKKKEFTKDYHVDNLLAFAAGTDLHGHQLYKSGNIIFQDKASCFPSYILSPPPGSHVIDCCAAPGNKTSHMSAIMRNKGKIVAFDLDSCRLKTMRKLCSTAGASNIEFKHQDFLTVDPSSPEFEKVEFILVDPSCSGSGIASRLSSLTDDDQSNSNQRLESLAKFQKSILHHALSFPKIKMVTYSTCSIHQTENEEVVKDVLQKADKKFHLELVLPSWNHRGNGLDNIGPFCIRASPREDLTNGFFVACFVCNEEVQSKYAVVSNESSIGSDVRNISNKINIVSNTQRNEEEETRATKEVEKEPNAKLSPYNNSDTFCGLSATTPVPWNSKAKKKKKKRMRKRKQLSSLDF